VEAVTASALGDDRAVRNVVVPTLTPYLPHPDLANGTAVIVAPGGGFHFLSWDNEGTRIAEWLVDRGVTAFVLKYRLADTGSTDESYKASMEALMQRLISQALQGGEFDLDSLVPDVRALAYADGQEAVRLVRRRAGEWGIDQAKVGFLGFSAGAFVSTAVALSEDPAARPDFVAPIYGGAVPGSVPADAPPLFAVVAGDDLLCREHTLRTVQAWLAAGRPAELHLYESGGHGFGATKLGLPVDGWLDRLAEWMQARGLL
jgi:acetyl esterase/lipase